VESAIQAGYFRDALWALETIIHTLRPAVHVSPILGTLLRTVAMLSTQVETVARVQKGVMEEVMLRSRISDLVQRSAVAGDVTRPISIGYSRASTELPREEAAEQLFSRPVNVSRW
jgi:hypothetical protein